MALTAGFAATVAGMASSNSLGNDFNAAFVNFETAPVHPIALSPDGARLAVCNLADAKLEVFDATSDPLRWLGSVAVGLDPVSARFRTATEAWVVNGISDSVSVVDIVAQRVIATIETLDTPADVVFAGTPVRAFVSCARPNTIQVFDPTSRQLLTNLVIEAERPKALAVSPDGRTVYAAIFESGNGTTLVGPQFRNMFFINNAVSRLEGPYGGQNPPPNRGTEFFPPLNPTLSTAPVPRTGIIVRKNAVGHWLDDNQRDWTEFVSGTNAASTQRVPGWDLPDRDLAVIDTVDYTIRYASGLMNLCMALEVNPASGQVAVVGTDALNEVRFESNLNGIFTRVKWALVDPLRLTSSVGDLNPHLDYRSRSVSAAERDRSLGDPRGIMWTADGSRAYVAGMGSRNVVVLDAEGNRLRAEPIEVGEGPCGLALHEARHRLYVFNRFSSSVSVVDTTTDTVIDAVPLFDPTPLPVAAGRRHLYDTRRTSGLGQASCASCHPDARMDRLAWDLGNPADEPARAAVNIQGRLTTHTFHPMKGVMLTQTLQDIIGHEPFHWRGDRASIEAFNGTFTNLQAAPRSLAAHEMGELRDFLASIRFPPNPFRNWDNSLATNVTLPGQMSLGTGGSPAGTPFMQGNAVAGLSVFNLQGNFCVTCHTAPTGLGLDSALFGSGVTSIPLGPNGEHHFPLATRLEGGLPSKIVSFRNLADRIGMDGARAQSRAGFGFGHDGSIDTLTRFANGVRVFRDRDVADLVAFLLSAPGADVSSAGATMDATPPASVGRQRTFRDSARTEWFDAMLWLARAPTSRVELIAKGWKDGMAQGFVFDRERDRFQSDRRTELLSPEELLSLAGFGSELTLTVVPRGMGRRLGIDRDLDDVFDRDEVDQGGDPSTHPWQPRILSPGVVARGTDQTLFAQISPLPAPGRVQWWKDSTLLVGATNQTLSLTNLLPTDAGSYVVTVVTPFQGWTSAPSQLAIAPLTVKVTLDAPSVRRGSNAVLQAEATGVGSFQYQWQFEGRNRNGATASSLVVSNAQLADEGEYRVVAANAFGAVTSAPVRLRILIAPTVVVPPLSQRVVEGGDATFSLEVAGHPPPFGYQLRRGSATLTNYVSDEPIAFLNLLRVQTNQSGTYRIIVTNAANPSPGLTLDPVTLTVLADTDHDSIPDEWELAHGLNPTNAADATLDFDGDTLNNAAEFVAGTDPHDATSFLRIEPPTSAGPVTLTFLAVSNRTYGIEFSDAVASRRWRSLAEVVARPTNHLHSVIDPALKTNRFYRLVTPRVR